MRHLANIVKGRTTLCYHKCNGQKWMLYNRSLLSMLISTMSCSCTCIKHASGRFSSFYLKSEEVNMTCQEKWESCIQKACELAQIQHFYYERVLARNIIYRGEQEKWRSYGKDTVYKGWNKDSPVYRVYNERSVGARLSHRK